MNIGPLEIRWKAKPEKTSDIRLKEEPGDPSDNSEEMLRTLVNGFEHIRNRTEKEISYFGRVFSVILFVENKLEQVLEGYDSKVHKSILGGKIEIYKQFLRELKRVESTRSIDFVFNFDAYDRSKHALAELNAIRRRYAHIPSFEYVDRKAISNIVAFNTFEREDLQNSIIASLPDDDYIIGQLYLFAFCFPHATAILINAQEVE